MAGIYIHIPFCKQACHYCNFHFSTSFEKYRTQMIDAICSEIELQANFFEDKKTSVHTVYFGGGTPSILTQNEFEQIWSALNHAFDLNEVQEVTLEANPDDMEDAFFEMIASSHINRLSIGVQSFDNLDLAYLNRVHDASKAISVIERSLNAGIDKISTDLIFGIPTSGKNRLEKDIRILANIGVNHISAYALTVEPDTALDHLIKKKKSIPVDESKSAEEMFWLMDFLPQLGYEQYETSNFSLPGCEAKHNSSYWHDIPYLGIGPSAHSYKKPIRSWNISNNMQYIRSIEQGKLAQESEILDQVSIYNEWVMTKIRLREGILFKEVEEQFGKNISKKFILSIEPYILSGDVIYSGNTFNLSKKGQLLTDAITSSLFL